MNAQKIDGNAIAAKIRTQIKEKIFLLRQEGHRPPCLSVLLVGDDPASKVYVAHKEKACHEVGIVSKTLRLPSSITQKELLRVIGDLNEDPAIDGILPQLPLPAGLDKLEIISGIHPSKDVDGLSFINQGRLLWNTSGLRPCTPSGILELLVQSNIAIEGKTAVVIGRSVLVGLPMCLLLMQYGATVTCVHSKTKSPEDICKTADILVAAAGVKHLVKEHWIKPGAVVIDVGIHRLEDKRLTGDVEPDAMATQASFYTPVPGGVGPMTIAMLLQNCFKAYCLSTKV